MAPASRRRLVKVLVPVVGIPLAAFAFWHTVHSARSAPYALTAPTQRAWRLTRGTGTLPNDPVLLLEPPSGISQELFDQVFKRSMESMRAPETIGIPLVLVGELAGRIPPDALVAMARAADLEEATPTPRCIGHRRLPEPDTRSQAYFAMFDSPAFTTFRANLATRLAPSFDAGFVTPALFVGFVESSERQWLPLHADADKDCVAPIVIDGT